MYRIVLYELGNQIRAMVWLLQSGHYFKVINFPLLSCLQFGSKIAKGNIDNTYLLIRYGNKICNPHIFLDVYKIILILL